MAGTTGENCEVLIDDADVSQCKKLKTSSGDYTLRKIRHDGITKWVKIPGKASYEDVINAIRETYHLQEYAIELSDEDGVIIDENVFDLFPTITLAVKIYNKSDLVIDGTTGIVLHESLEPVIPGDVQELTNSAISEFSLSTNSEVAGLKIDHKESRTYNNLDLLNDVRRTPGGSELIDEYNKLNNLTPRNRRKLVNIVVNQLIERFGYHPSTDEKIAYAKAIVVAFPGLKDPGSAEGYELFYDPSSRSGYIAWRLRTLNRHKREDTNKCEESKVADVADLPPQLDEIPSPDEVTNNISFLKNACSKSQNAEIEAAMKITLHVRRANPEKILTDFPKFLDTPYMINLEFSLMYPGVIISKFSPDKIMRVAEKYLSHQSQVIGSSEPDWDLTTRAYITLIKLLPPTAKGRKRSERDSVTTVTGKLIVFEKLGTPVKSIVVMGTQPTLIAIGANKSAISTYFIAMDGTFLPIESTSSAEAFDQLFKAHYVFDTKYETNLSSFYGFLQSFYYGMHENVKFTPRMREVRNWLSQA